jgi:hypothetical protein
MTDEAKVRELFAPAQSRQVDVEGKRFKVNRERIISAMLRARGEVETDLATPARWRTVAAMAAGFAVLVGSAGWFVLRRPHGAPTADQSLSVSGVRGVVTRVDHGVGRSFAPGQVATISPDGEFITAPQSEASVRAVSGLEIEIFEKTQLSLAGLGPAGANTVNLATGDIRCRVPHLAEGRTFSIITPDATVVVHGTVFRVTVTGQAGATETCVRVEEGIVGVQTAAGETLVTAKQSRGCSLDELGAAPRAPSPSNKPLPSPASQVAKQRQAEPARAQAGTLDEENRLFEAGISAERRGDVHGAGSFFEQLLSHYPGG